MSENGPSSRLQAGWTGCIAPAVFLSMLACPALSYPVTWSFTAGPAFPEDFNHGTYTFESTTPRDPNGTDVGSYPGAIHHISGEVGPVAFEGPAGPTNVIEITNDLVLSGCCLVDTYRVSVDIVSDLGSRLQIWLPLPATAFSSDDLPLEPPLFDSFPRSSFAIGDVGPDGRFDANVRMLVTSLVLVPEPGSLALLALGAFVQSIRHSVGGVRRTDGPVRRPDRDAVGRGRLQV